MKTISLTDRLNQRLVEFDARLDASLEMGENLIDFDDGDKKKGSAGKTAAEVAGGTAAAGGLGAAGLYAHGRRVSGGNATGKDAFRVGARDISNKASAVKSAIGSKVNDARFYGNYYAGAGAAKAKQAANATKTGVTKGAGAVKSGVIKAVKKVRGIVKMSALDRLTELAEKADAIINFETIDDATARKPKNPMYIEPKGRKPDSKVKAIAAVGAGTAIGAAAGHYGTKHSAQLAKAGSKGISIAKAGYKTGTSKAASIGKGMMSNAGEMIRKIRRK